VQPVVGLRVLKIHNFYGGLPHLSYLRYLPHLLSLSLGNFHLNPALSPNARAADAVFSRFSSTINELQKQGLRMGLHAFVASERSSAAAAANGSSASSASQNASPAAEPVHQLSAATLASLADLLPQLRSLTLIGQGQLTNTVIKNWTEQRQQSSSSHHTSSLRSPKGTSRKKRASVVLVDAASADMGRRSSFIVDAVAALSVSVESVPAATVAGSATPNAAADGESKQQSAALLSSSLEPPPTTAASTTSPSGSRIHSRRASLSHASAVAVEPFSRLGSLTLIGCRPLGYSSLAGLVAGRSLRQLVWHGAEAERKLMLPVQMAAYRSGKEAALHFHKHGM